MQSCQLDAQLAQCTQPTVEKLDTASTMGSEMTAQMAMPISSLTLARWAIWPGVRFLAPSSLSSSSSSDSSSLSPSSPCSAGFLCD